jgi:hypothetical protein
MDSEGGSLHGIDRESGDPINELDGNTAGETPDHRFPLPHGFRYGESEAFFSETSVK